MPETPGGGRMGGAGGRWAETAKERLMSDRTEKGLFREWTLSYNPATGEAIGSTPVDTLEDVRGAVAKARAAQADWAGTPVSERAEALVRVRGRIVDRADEIAAVISKDSGKTRVDALATEVLPAAMAVSYYARKAEGFLEDRPVSPGSLLFANKRSRIVRVPWGVVGIISPWNYPFAIPFSEAIMALLAGNAVVLKVATETQIVARALAECIGAAGLPEGVFACVNLPGKVAGDALLEGGVNKLFFTGSVTVGKSLMRKASETLTPLSLELGGNDAMLVCEDADLERAAAGAAWAGLQNAGQSCGGVERIYVHEAAYAEFLGILKERVESLRVGPDTDFQVDVGAMTTRRQVETVQRHVRDALGKGAVLFAKSEAPEGSKGHFLPAMVLTDVDHRMLLMREETFGPVVGVMKVKDMEEALALANDSNLGLTGSVWSADAAKADSIARRMQAGAVLINDHLMSHGLPETPWGGFKESSLGRAHGELGFDEMTQPQVIVRDILPGVKRDLWWYPHGRALYEGFLGVLDLLYSPELPRRLRGLWRVLKLAPRMFEGE
jgi:acyl-CoA reductase-like NAD-dependent aldehyde dehydrogenase